MLRFSSGSAALLDTATARVSGKGGSPSSGAGTKVSDIHGDARLSVEISCSKQDLVRNMTALYPPPPPAPPTTCGMHANMAMIFAQTQPRGVQQESAARGQEEPASRIAPHTVLHCMLHGNRRTAKREGGPRVTCTRYSGLGLGVQACWIGHNVARLARSKSGKRFIRVSIEHVTRRCRVG